MSIEQTLSSSSVLALRCLKLVLTVLMTIVANTVVEAADRPNVVVFLADDQGWGDLSLNGNTNLSTPRIDSIGRDGAIVEHFYVCQLCAPTRAELLTGRYHPRTGVSGVSTGLERMRPDEVTIANVLQDAGYATGCFGKWHNGTQSPLHPNDRGFGEFYGFTSGHWGNYFDADVDHNGQAKRSTGYLTDDLTSQAIEFIRRHKSEPFFCYVPFNTPHTPMQVPDSFYEAVANRSLDKRARAEDGEQLSMTRAALAMVENIDFNVGRVLKTLDELQLSEKTIIVYLSDNGPNSARWNGDMKGQKGTIDEGGLRSPLLIRWTGTIAPQTVITPIAGAVDLLPTIADLTGTSLSVESQRKRPLDGQSLKPLLMQQSSPWPERTLASVRNVGGRNASVSLRTDRFRLDSTGALFDLQTDPGQRTDVAVQHPELVTKLREEAARHLRQMKQELGNPQRPFHVGYSQTTWLPARDGVSHGQIQRSTRAPNDSFFTNWKELSDSIVWGVEVGQSGVYEATLTYTCPPGDVGATVELRAEGQSSVATRIEEPFDPPLVGKAFDRHPRGGESEVKEFRPLVLGRFRLEAGETKLTLRATEIPGSQVGDVKSLILTRVDEAN